MARLLVVGSSNTDMTVSLPHLPAPGQTVLGGSLLTGQGGKGANQAVAAARAGAEVIFVAAVGDDAFGRQSVACYQNEGIDVGHVRTVPGVASGIALILVGEGGENMIGVASGANARLSPEDIDVLPSSLFCAGGWLLVAGLEVPLDTVARAVKLARVAGMKVVLNPAPAQAGFIEAGLLGAVDVLTPNRVELGMLTGRTVASRTQAFDAAERLRTSGVGRVVVTLGAEGCLIVSESGQSELPAHHVKAVDTVGAGDAFSAAMAVALAEGRTLHEAASWATAAAAVAVTRPGAQDALPRRAEIDRLASARC